LEKIQERASAEEKSVSAYVRACLLKEILDPIIEKVRILRKYRLSDEDICKQAGLTKEGFYMYMKVYPKFFMAARDFNVTEQAKAEDGLYRGDSKEFQEFREHVISGIDLADTQDETAVYDSKLKKDGE
jgi:hypothetical protein